MRIIDADDLKESIENIVSDEMKIDDKWATGLRYALKLIDNAPTVEPDVNCSHCDYLKFSRSFIENLVGFMLEHEIYTVDDLMTELNHINELNRVKDELNNELKEEENECKNDT